MRYLDRNYTFDASAKTVTFDSWANIDFDRILLITNQTANVVIFNFASTTKGGSVSTNVLTLEYDTTSQNDSDDLQIWVLTELEKKVDETTNATYTYIGAAVPGTATSSAYWQIYRFETSGDINKEYADSDDKFNNVWDDRDSLSY